MTATWRIFRNEAAKLARMRMLLLAPVCILAVGFIFAVNTQRVQGGQSGNGWSILVQTAKFNVTGVIPVFLLIYSAALVAGENDRGTIRLVLTRPVSRFAFVLGKSMGTWLCLAFLLGCVVVSGLIIGGSLGRFDAIENFGEPAFSVGQAASQIGACFLLTAIPLAAVAGFGLTVSVFSPSLLGAICFSIGSWITIVLAQGFVVGSIPIGSHDLTEFLFSNVLDYPLSVAELVSSGSTAPWDDPSRMIWVMTTSLAWIVGFLGLSTAAFSRQDLNRH